MPNVGDLEEKAICHSLESFSFSKDPFAVDDTFFHNHATSLDDDDDDHENEPFQDGIDPPMDMDGDMPAPVEDFFVGDQAVGDDYMPDDPGAGSPGSPDQFGDDEGGTGDNGEPQHPPAEPRVFMPFDPRRAPNERDLVLAMTDAEGGVMMDYFDQSFLKNWAGPEHWKLRKVVRRREFSPDFIDRLLRFKRETNVSMLRSFVLSFSNSRCRRSCSETAKRT